MRTFVLFSCLALPLTARAGTPDPAAAHDFTPQAAALHRVIACGGAAEVPARFDAAQVKQHCDVMQKTLAAFRAGWLAKATPFLATLRPAELPPRVVYPFAGGDLISALVTFPDATEYTGMSIETAGDPRAIDTVTPKQLAATMTVTEKNIAHQFMVAHNLTNAMAAASADILPAQVIFSLVALEVYDVDPSRLLYFRIAPSGQLEYVDDADLAGGAKDLFDNMEIRFTWNGKERVFRHIGANLDNQHLAENVGLMKHLEAKGQVAAMTKAASYLLWGTRFTTIRDYLVKNMAWMISDSTGITPSVAQSGGFVLETYGRYEGAFLDNASKTAGAEMLAYWQKQPKRDVPMAYGYPDNNHHAHLMVAKKTP
jgi:hypothetical protein